MNCEHSWKVTEFLAPGVFHIARFECEKCKLVQTLPAFEVEDRLDEARKKNLDNQMTTT